MKILRMAVLVAAVIQMIVTNHLYAHIYADVLGYYEPGQNINLHFPSNEFLNNPSAALGGPGQTVLLDDGVSTTNIVSLGAFSDDPNTGSNDRPPSLVVGFSSSVSNQLGPDLRVVGNAPSAFIFYEPSIIEVAPESTGPGATPNGWTDETFFLIKPSNFDDLEQDPRLAPTKIPYDNLNLYGFPFDESGSYTGYADVTPSGDLVDISDAIDISGQPANLSDIAYLRFRSISDSLYPWGASMSPEIDYVKAVPEPSSLLLCIAGCFGSLRRRAASRHRS